MGARQSKRSVDITTATGGATESGGEVVAGKLGKLEDGVGTPETVAPKQNGDAVLKDKERQLESETPENEKDSSTEKGLLVVPAASDSATTPAAVENGLGDASPDAELPNAASPVSAKDTDKTPEEEPQSPTSAEESQEVTSPTSEEKQSEKKKEKKKKWSFRSISFSKKDKQKPSKKQQQEENGDIEKVPEEATDETVAAASGGDVPAEKTIKEEKSAANTEENLKTEEVSACKKPESPVAENTSEKPVAQAPIQQVCEKPEAPKAEIACEKVCEKPAVEPVPIPTEQVKVEIPAALDAVSEQVKTEPVKVEEIPKPEPVIASPVAEKPETKQEEEKLSPASVADENQKEVCDKISPPPLPDSLPPSQVSVFAETMMALPETVTSLHETSAPILVQSEPCPLPKQTPVQNLVSLLKVEDVPASKDSENVSTAQVGITAEILSSPVELSSPPVVELPAELPPAELPPTSVVETVAPAVESSTEKLTESNTIIPEEKTPEPVLPSPAGLKEEVLVSEIKASEPVPPAPADVQENNSPAGEEKVPETNEITTPEVNKEIVATTAVIDVRVPEVPSKESPTSDAVLLPVEVPITPVLSDTAATESQKDKDLPSPPPSPASSQETDVNVSLPPTEEQLPSPPPSPISAVDTSISESGAVNTNTEEQLPSPPPSPAASVQETSTDSPLPPPATEDLPQSSDEHKTGSFDESAPLPPPPSALDSMTTVETNGALICPPSPPAPESLPVQQVTSNENIAEVSATESTQSEELIQVSPKIVAKEIDEKIPGMVMLDGMPPLEVPITENSVAVAEN